MAAWKPAHSWTTNGSGEWKAAFDLNGDGILSTEDIDIWTTDLAMTFAGDTDPDRGLSFSDFLVLSGNIGTDGGWADGNFNGDGSVSFADFLVLLANFGKSSAAISVPEPTGGMLRDRSV